MDVDESRNVGVICYSQGLITLSEKLVNKIHDGAPLNNVKMRSFWFIDAFYESIVPMGYRNSLRYKYVKVENVGIFQYMNDFFINTL